MRISLSSSGSTVSRPASVVTTFQGATLAFGQPVAPQTNFDKAKVILGLDSDFLGLDWQTPLPTKQFSSRRHVSSEEDLENINRLYAVESQFSLTGANAVGKVSFCAEAGLFQEAEIPTVICGPGSIDVAHKPNEYVAIDQVRQCERFLRGLMDHLAR